MHQQNSTLAEASTGNACGKDEINGYMLIDKPLGKSAFHLVAVLRKRLRVKKIGHAGTLDPLATGVMVMLIGRYTKLSDQFLSQRKEYIATIHLGIETDSYDGEGKEIARNPLIPSDVEVKEALTHFQGDVLQVPPMFSAKKINGQKLYNLARQGKEIERPPVDVNMEVELIEYAYPIVKVRVDCSKGTYIRSLAHDLGRRLGSGAYLAGLVRTKSGSFGLESCISPEQLYSDEVDLKSFLQVGMPQSSKT
jgi:tRNA pseudouridine55 synthase